MKGETAIESIGRVQCSECECEIVDVYFILKGKILCQDCVKKNKLQKAVMTEMRKRINKVGK